jgi:glutamate-5-semialdehyde dehydrogenase
MNDFPGWNLRDLVNQAHQASAHLAQTPIQGRNAVLKELLGVVQSQQDTILEANTLDLETTRDLAIAELGLQWLKLTPERLSVVRQFIESLIGLPDPLQVSRGTVAHSLHSLSGFRIMPQGVICGLYEFLPEFPILLASLCLKTGNSLLVRGTAETSHTHELWTQMISHILHKSSLDPGCFCGFPSDRTVTPKDLVTHQLPINLIIPYGRPNFIQDIARQGIISPVLAPAIGNCYLFCSASGNSDLARAIILDSHCGTPDAVSAIEKVLITPNTNFSLLNVLFSHLREKGFILKGDETLTADFPDLTLAEPNEWSQPYLHKTVAFKVVNTLAEGIQWINCHSSGQADVLITDSYRECQQFALGITSASLFFNASPRFSRLTSGPKGTVALGMIGRNALLRGPIGTDTLLKPSQLIHGVGNNLVP